MEEGRCKRYKRSEFDRRRSFLTGQVRCVWRSNKELQMADYLSLIQALTTFLDAICELTKVGVYTFIVWRILKSNKSEKCS